MLSESQMLRFSRHVLLREVGGRGQRRLLDACVGVSRLDVDGRACLLWLARSGVGTLSLPTDRTAAPATDPSGLLLASDEGRPLHEAVRERLRFHAPDVRLEADCEEWIDPTGGALAALRVVRGLVASSEESRA